MGIPDAHIVHRSAYRLRIRVHDEKGNSRYFADTRDRLSKCPGCDAVSVNPMTGSVLICGNSLNIKDIMDFAESNQLFRPQMDISKKTNPDSYRKKRRRGIPLPMFIISPLRFIGGLMSYITRGVLDLNALFFISLICIGAYDLAAKRPLRLPSWYTAFWYAYGLAKVWEKHPAGSKLNSKTA